MDWRYSNTITLSSFNHIVTPLFHFSSSFLSLLSLIWCLSQIDVDWRSTSTVWIEGRRWQRGGLVIDGDGVVVWSGGDGGFSFSNSDSLFLSLWFSLSNWMWVLVLLWIFVGVLMPNLWWQRWGIAMLVGMDSLWVYVGCYRCGWRFGGSGSVGLWVFWFSLSDWV